MFHSFQQPRKNMKQHYRAVCESVLEPRLYRFLRQHCNYKINFKSYSCTVKGWHGPYVTCNHYATLVIHLLSETGVSYNGTASLCPIISKVLFSPPYFLHCDCNWPCCLGFLGVVFQNIRRLGFPCLPQ